MLAPILIAYSTRTGATSEVANEIAEVLRQTGVTVELTRMRDLKSIGPCSALILGSPLYMGRLTRETHRFLRRHRRQLAYLPARFFVLGPLGGKPWEFRQSAQLAAHNLAKYAGLKLKEIKVFGGRFDPHKLPFPYSLLLSVPGLPLKNDPPSDCRNWNDIRAWASQIGEEFAPPEEDFELELKLTGTYHGR